MGLQQNLLMISLILIIIESNLRAIASSTVIEPEITKTINIAEVGRISDSNRHEKEASLENCLYQPKPLATETETIPIVTLQVNNQPVFIKLRGSTVFKREQIINNDTIKQLIQPIERQHLSDEQFRAIYREIVKAITQLYLTEGYITSEAIFPPEPLIITNEGVAEIPVSEGCLADIKVAGRERLNLSYVCSRIQLAVSNPLNIIKIEEQLRLLNSNPLLKNVKASLKDSGKLGLSSLTVSIQEAKSFTSNFNIDNYSPPSLGSERLGIGLSYGNVTGLGDKFSATYYLSTTGGVNLLDALYQVPLNSTEGTLQLRATLNKTKITQSSLEQFDITGDQQVYEINYRQPLTRTLRKEFSLSLGFRLQDGQTFGLNRAELFGNSRTSTIYFGPDYISRDPRGFLLLRSQFNFGTGLFNPTIKSDSSPDGLFFSWFNQVQSVQQLDEDNLLIIQGDLQLTPDSLLPYYLFIIGGGQSVRGYRQNVRSGDNGFCFSIEDRITVSRDQQGSSRLQIAPFLDIGKVWNSANNPQRLPSQTFLVGVVLD